MQGGFHAIGDAAIETVLDGFAIAAKAIGVDRLRAGRHRIEHVELADKAMIARMVEFGVVASRAAGVRPLWGGKDRMYAQRLGVERALASNPIGAMHATGVLLAFGSDSPVTALDPWTVVVAAAAPRNPIYRMSVRAAFAALHARRLAGRRPGRRGRAVAGLVGDVRDLGHPGRRRVTACRRCCRTRTAAAPSAPGLPAHGPARRNDLRGVESMVGGKLRLDPRVVRAGARRWRRRPGSRWWTWRGRTPRCRWSGRCCGWPGCAGADSDGIPWVNRLVDAVRADVGLGHGVAVPVFHALAAQGFDDVTVLAQKAAAGAVRFAVPQKKAEVTAARRLATRATGNGLKIVDRRRAERERLIRRYGDPAQRPWIYLIVATGDIYEDIPQAQAAARAGADVIAVIRSTGQSLLDYVPEGATREGFAGTYATQENFRLMRAALDETSKELGRYVRLTNYASGLCMPEIAALAGLERLDMMLNDSMYGILFRDINPIRTFVDQRFSRQVHARAGIIINTGEDNYLTTADAVEAAHTVTVSQLLNEFFAHEAGLADWQLGLGHAFEINPDLPESFRLELAHALLARELFPDAPLKWMPPTKHMTGDVFRGNLLDGFFNLAGALTGQGILLVGMMTEAVVTPWLSDRDIALQNVRYVLNGAGNLHEDFVPAPGGFIQQRAHAVLGEAVDLLERIVDDTLLNAIADGTFGIMKRPADRGKGLDGVARHERRTTTTRSPWRWRPRNEHRAALRRHHRRRDGAAVVHPADPARQARRGRGGAAGRTRWAWTRRCWCTPSRWATATPSSWCTAGSATWSTPTRCRWSSGTSRCCRPRRSTR